MHPHDLHAEHMLERLKTSDAMADQAKMDSGFSNSNLPCGIRNSNLVLPSRIDLANEVLDLRDLTERYWRVITAQHVRIALLENELLCVKTAKP
jgi:hypothetical protein